MTDDKPPGRTQINIKIRPEQKAKWENTVENNPEYQSLTHLIQLAVSREIATQDSAPTDRREPTIRRDIAELKDVVTPMSEDISMLKSAIADMQRAVQTTPSDKHLRSEIFAALPTPASRTGPVSAETLADDLGPIEETVVAEVLSDLESDVNIVEERIDTDGTSLYWKRD